MQSDREDDDQLNMALNDDDSLVNLEKKNTITVINTNARSLCPKIDSLVDCFSELDVDIAIITETWFRDGGELDQVCSDLELGAGLCSITLNRDPNPTTGVAHGGVAIITKKKMGKFKQYNFPNPDKFEVLPAVGTMSGSSRKFVVVGAYIPPNYPVARGNACVEYLEELIVDIKRKLDDPFIVLGGDFNQWAAHQAIVEFPDLTEVELGPTRGERTIDRLFTNMGRSIETSGTVPPLEAENSASDHRIAYFTAKVARREAFEWVTYTYRLCTEEAKKDFGTWVVTQDWSEVLAAEGSDAKVKAYQDIIDAALDTFSHLRPLVKSRHNHPG